MTSARQMLRLSPDRVGEIKEGSPGADRFLLLWFVFNEFWFGGKNPCAEALELAKSVEYDETNQIYHLILFKY